MEDTEAARNDLELSERAKKIIDSSLKAVRERYGNGGPESQLLYHNESHTRGVINNLRQLIRTYNRDNFPDSMIRSHEEELLLIIAAAHDRVQLLGPGTNEKKSAEEVAEDMREAGYKENEITFVKAGIFATIPEFSPGKITQPLKEVLPMLEKGEIDERQLEFIKLVADADLDAFGASFTRCFYDTGSLNLFYEIRKAQGKDTNPKNITREDILPWLQTQYSIMSSHQWVSKVGEATFPNKAKLLEEFQKLIVDVESGSVDIEALVTPRFK